MHNSILVKSLDNKKISHNFNYNNKIFNEDDIINAIVIEKNNDNILLETSDGVIFNTSTNNIFNVGDILKFKVTKYKNNDLQLKFLNKVNDLSIKNPNHLSKTDTILFFKQSNFIKDSKNKNNLLNETNESKKSQAISRLQNKLKYIKNNITLSIVNELLSNGVSFKNIDLDMLNNTLKEVKLKYFDLSQYNLDKKNNILKQLTDNKLPITQENINFINKSLKTFENIKNLNEQSLIYILKDNKENINLKNIYISKYSCTNNLKLNDKIDLKINNLNLEDKIKDFLSEENIDINKENIDISKFLIKNNIEINKNNINTYKFLEKIDSKIDISQIIKSSIFNLKFNKNADDINLYNTKYNITLKQLEDNYRDILNYLPKISINNIINLEENNLPITLLNLKQSINNNINKINIENISENTNKYNLQLAEIQLKLTSEASYKLINKNIKIDILPLKKVIKELRNLDESYYKDILESKNIESTKDNIDKMCDIFNKVSHFKNIPINSYNKILHPTFYPSINNIDKSISYTKILENYNIFSTSVNKKYGDSIKNLDEQLKLLLENLCIDINENNIKASNILFKNNMDVNKENILKVNIINKKLELIKDKLHPIIACNMIKEGINPLNIHIDKILDYINKFNDEYGNNLNNKLYENILKLDKIDDISEKEKKSIIAIYKMINYINKNGSACLGTNIMSGHNLTLGNLLNASKYYNKTKTKLPYSDIKIDDNYLKKQTDKKYIKNIINESLEENNAKKNEDYYKTIYDNLTISTLGEKLDYNIFIKLMKNDKNILDKNINKILEDINKIKNDIEYDNNTESNIFNFIKNILSKDVNTLNFMEQNNIPLTFENIKTIINLNKNKNYIEDCLNYVLEKTNNKNLINKITKNNIHESSLENILDDLEDIIFLKNSSLLINKIKQIQNSIKIKNKIYKNKENYSIPVKIKDKITNLNMFIPNNVVITKNNIEIAMYINIPYIGDIKSYIIKNDKDIYIQDDISNNKNILKDNEKQLKELFKSNGFNLKDISFNKSQIDFESYNKSIDKKHTREYIKKEIFNIASILTEFLNKI